MAGLTRKFFKIFGIDAPSRIGVFGSFAEGAPATSTDPEVIQSLEPWSDGWDGAIPPEEGAPALQDFNGFFYAISYQMAYMLERGVPDWNTNTTYNIGDIAKNAVGSLFRSLQDTNLNHALTDVAWWYPVSGAGGLTPVGVSVTGTCVANTEENVDVSGGTLVRTLPPLPLTGAVPISILVLDTGNASDTKLIGIQPATGELINLPGFVANDGVQIDYPRGWAAFYGVPGASSWKVQTQANTMGPPPGMVPGYKGVTAIPAGMIGENYETVLGPTASPGTNTIFNVGSLVLQPGQYRISAMAAFFRGTVTANTYFVIGVNTVSATLRSNRYTQLAAALGTMNVPAYGMDVLVPEGTTQTIYAVAQYDFSAVGNSSVTAYIQVERFA